MLKAAFILLRVVTAIASLAALTGTMLAMLLTSAFEIAKAGGHIFMVMARFFASGLRDPGPSPSNPPNPNLIMLPMVALAVLFLAMFASVFTPGVKIFLHIVAAGAVIATVWRIWFLTTDPNSPAILYLPIIALWFIYYGVCLRRLAIARRRKTAWPSRQG